MVLKQKIIKMKRLVTLFACLLFYFIGFAQNDAYQFNALLSKASAEYDKKNYQLALDQYEKALKINQQYIAYYNAACCASLMGDLSKAALYLTKSIELGYLDIHWLSGDTDFDSLKKTEDWVKIMDEIGKNVSTVEAQLTKIKSVQLSDLVPFQKEEKWGYLDKNTRKIIVPPIFLHANFGGDCLLVKLNEKYWIQIDGHGKFMVYRSSGFDMMPPPPPFFPSKVIADSTKEYKGFKVNEYGRITHASAYYDASLAMGSMESGGIDYPSHPIVYSPVKIDSVWWAIACKNEKRGLINENGKVHDRLKMDYQELSLLKETKKGETWYYFKDAKNNCGLINPKGEVKFYKEIDSFNPYSLEMTGFLEVKKGELTGVIDLLNVGWALKPNTHRIEEIQFSHDGKCINNYNLLRDRNKMKEIYFLCSDKQTVYFMDKKGVKYLPVE